jgi:3'-5' exonuclease
MNNSFQKINIEKILFFDIEVARNQESLDINSKEFELFQKKTRDKATDELLPDDQVLTEYNRLAGLKMGYNKIVCISVGVVSKGKVYLKSFKGEEKEILDKLYELMFNYDYVCGYNIVGYDLPMCQFNYLRYGIPKIPEAFNVSGKKPWELKSIIELMDVVRGTHFANPSLDEVCFHLGIPSPKEGGIDGSMVSDVYYKEGVDRIASYCNRDVFSVINLFQRLQNNPLFESFIEREDEAPQNIDVFTIINRFDQSTTNQNKILLKKAKGFKKKAEREALVELVKASLARTEFSEEEQELFTKLLKP